MDKEQRKILIIDDEEDLVEIMKSMLLDEGYHVMTASNGEEGLRQIEKSEPHLIVLDINMPKMGGIAFYHEIYDKNLERPKYPVLVVTARGSLEDIFRELNVDGFMTKPFKMDHFVKEADLIISRRYGMGPVEKDEKQEGPQKVLLVDKDPENIGKVINTFLSAGYQVQPTNSAVRAIEMAMEDRPGLILISLKLDDLPGDILACRLKQMPRTMDIPVVLYSSETDKMQLMVATKLCQKVGVKHIIATNSPEELLKEASYALQDK